MRTKVKRYGRGRNRFELPLLDWADRRRRREPARSFAAREMQRQRVFSKLRFMVALSGGCCSSLRQGREVVHLSTTQRRAGADMYTRCESSAWI